MKNHLTCLVLVACIVVANCASFTSGIKFAKKKDDLRLFKDIIPVRYDLTLWASPHGDHFRGKVIIDIKINERTNEIRFHGQDLDVASVLLKSEDKNYDGVFKNVNNYGVAVVSFDQTLNAGNYQLEINYEGHFQEDLQGLYRVKEGGEFYIFSQLEPLSARKMLPCFDDPQFKTPFKLSVITDSQLAVITNAGLLSSSRQGQNTLHVFHETKPISTYLLALAIGPFDVVEGPPSESNTYRQKPIAIRGITTKGKGKQIHFALEEAPRIVEALEDYFKSPFPFDKIDILAVPDFRAGAMENVGALSFREWYVLMNQQNVAIDQLLHFYWVLSHELAHQWFGNSVSMPWWDDLWLNEGFATWLGYKITDILKPEFKSRDYLLKRSFATMKEDSVKSARKIREPINSVHDISNAFDTITYAKGASVLAMLENYVGDDTFQKAVSDYVERFKYSVTSSHDFLASLAAYADHSLIMSAESFLNQRGVPVVDISYTCKDREFQIDIKQNPYKSFRMRNGKHQIWDIPVCVSYLSGRMIKKYCFMVDKKINHFTVKNDSCPAYIMPNAGSAGYYRFSMNQKDWNKLVSVSGGFSERERLAMADSLMGELLAGRLDFGFVIEQLRHFLSIQSSLLSYYFLDLIKMADSFWVKEENREILRAYAKDALLPLYAQLKALKDPSMDQRSLKGELLSFLALVIKDQAARDELMPMGTKFLSHIFNGPAAQLNVDAGLFGDALAVVLQTQDAAYVKKVAGLLHGQTDPVVREGLLAGLALAREGRDADEIRELIFAGGLRKNEKIELFNNHLDNPHNQPATWQFLQHHYADFQSDLSSSEMAPLISLARGLCDIDRAQSVRKFFGPVIGNFEGGPRLLDEMAEEIETCANMKEHMSGVANDFLLSFKSMLAGNRSIRLF